VSREAVVSIMLIMLDIEQYRSRGHFVEAVDEVYRLVLAATKEVPATDPVIVEDPTAIPMSQRQPQYWGGLGMHRDGLD